MSDTHKLRNLGYQALHAFDDLAVAEKTFAPGDDRVRLAREKATKAELDYFNLRSHLEQEARALLSAQPSTKNQK